MTSKACNAVRSRAHRPRSGFRRAWWFAASMLCLHAGRLLAAAEPVPVTPEQSYQLALEARTVRDYPSMLALLRQAGEGGDLRAQELLGSVLLLGSALYGESIKADPCEAAQWIRQAVKQGSPVGRHQSVVLNGLRELPAGDCEAGRPALGSTGPSSRSRQ